MMGKRSYLFVSPKLDDKTLSTVIVQFTAKAGDTPIAMVELTDDLPDEVARYKLALTWEARPVNDPSDFDFPKTTTEHSIFAIYDTPYEADTDSTAPTFTGKHVTLPDTVTGTQKRFDKLMSLFGGSRRHPAATPDDLRELLWRVHTGVNDFGSPPYFNAIHDRHLTVDGGVVKHYDASKRVVVGSDPLTTDDQWLMWLPTGSPPNWNSAACIGYVQLIKTMMAAVGIFARRAWVVPHTLQLPNGTTIALKEDDLWCLGEEDSSKWQAASLVDDRGVTRTGTLVLMEPDRGGERFEACLYTPDKHFLPGGYRTPSVDRDAPGFAKNRGFTSALDVLRWWCTTKREAFQRFMCWADLNNLDANDKPVNFWDRDGRYYGALDYEKIVKTGRQVPPP